MAVFVNRKETRPMAKNVTLDVSRRWLETVRAKSHVTTIIVATTVVTVTRVPTGPMTKNVPLDVSGR